MKNVVTGPPSTWDPQDAVPLAKGYHSRVATTDFGVTLKESLSSVD